MDDDTQWVLDLHVAASLPSFERYLDLAGEELAKIIAEQHPDLAATQRELIQNQLTHDLIEYNRGLQQHFEDMDDVEIAAYLRAIWGEACAEYALAGEDEITIFDIIQEYIRIYLTEKRAI